MTPTGAPPDPLRLVAGAAAVAGTLALWPARQTLALARSIPAVATPLQAATTALAARGDEALRRTVDAARTGLRIVVREIVAAALDEVDITAIVRDHVDLDAVAEGIDVDRIAARVDLDAIIRRIDVDAIADTLDLQRQIARVDIDGVASTLDLDTLAAGLDADAVVSRVDLDAIISRIDLIGLANQIIAAVDLPQIIRDSTGSLSEEAVRGVRSQGMQADDAVAGFVGRLFGRDRTGTNPAGTNPADTSNGTPDGSVE